MLWNRSNESENKLIKLVDLDSNQKDEADQIDEPKAKSGTPYYMAPELFADEGVHSF